MVKVLHCFLAYSSQIVHCQRKRLNSHDFESSSLSTVDCSSTLSVQHLQSSCPLIITPLSYTLHHFDHHLTHNIRSTYPKHAYLRVLLAVHVGHGTVRFTRFFKPCFQRSHPHTGETLGLTTISMSPILLPPVNNASLCTCLAPRTTVRIDGLILPLLRKTRGPVVVRDESESRSSLMESIPSPKVNSCAYMAPNYESVQIAASRNLNEIPLSAS